MNPQVIGVSQFVAILNETLGFAYPQVTVEGEVSGFKVNQRKWVFFDLKDDSASLPCFMPLYLLKVELEDGMKIRVGGSPRLTKWGKFSFTAREIALAGEGELRRAYELLKARLEAEGLFEVSRKRPLPAFPRQIGLVTSVGSAAYGDFLKLLNARWQGVTVKVADVQVQGRVAPDQIVAAIDHLNGTARPVDVLVVIRGGGSLEDLQAFNTEAVARAVASSRTPTVVGVGHETDVSLADLAADVRAATPTDAARLAVPDRQQLSSELSHGRERLLVAMATQVAGRLHSLRQQTNRLERFWQEPATRVTRLAAALARDISHFGGQLQRQSRQLELSRGQLVNRQTGLVAERRSALKSLERVLTSFDPRANLNRGYSIVTHNRRLVKSSGQVKSGDSLMIQLAEGKLRSRVTDGRD